MPFQGNPNAGAANPAIIQLLFAERERRARQQQEAEQAQFERMLKLQEAEQKRQEFELKRLNQQADLLGKIRPLVEDVSSARRAESEAKGSLFTMDDLTIGKSGRRLGPEMGVIPGAQGPRVGAQPSFADIVSGLDPSAPAQVQFTNQAEANRRNQENTLAAYMQGAAGIGPQDALSAVRGQSFAQEFEEQRQSDIDLQRTIAQENRQAAKEASAKSREVDASLNRIEQLETRLGGLRPGTKEYENTNRRLVSQRRRLQRLENESMPEFVGFARQQAQQDFEIAQTSVQLVDQLRSVIAAAEDDPNFLGYQGSAANLIGYFQDAGFDINAVAQDFLERDLRDPNVSAETKSELREFLFGSQSDETVLQQSASLDLLANRVAFTITRLNNPGRISDAQIRESKALTNFSGGTSRRALRQMRSALAVLDAQAKAAIERFNMNDQGMRIDPDTFQVRGPSGDTRANLRVGGGLPGFTDNGGNAIPRVPSRPAPRPSGISPSDASALTDEEFDRLFEGR